MKNRKALWILLIALISFDNIFSYAAIAYHGMREANPVTAFFVSLNPLFYFVSIPVTLLWVYGLIRFIGWLGEKSDKSKLYTRELIETMTLTCVVIVWGIGITSFNAATLLSGFSPPRIDWRIIIIIGGVLAAAYALFTEHRMKGRK